MPPCRKQLEYAAVNSLDIRGDQLPTKSGAGDALLPGQGIDTHIRSCLLAWINTLAWEVLVNIHAEHPSPSRCSLQHTCVSSRRGCHLVRLKLCNLMH